MKIVIINCFDTYQHRSELLSTFFQQKGWDVLQLRSDFSHRKKAKLPCIEPRPDIVFFPAKPYQKNLSVARLRSHHQFALDCADYLEHLDAEPDLLWVLLPPNSLAKTCARYKQAHPAVNLVFDLIDLWPETFPMGGVKWLPPFHVWRQLRDRNLPIADYIVTECELFRKKLALPPTKASTIYMCDEEPPRAVPLTQPSMERYELCYLGSVNHIIDIDAILNIIKELKLLRPVSLHVIGEGENLDQLLEKATQAGASAIYHGAVFDPVKKQEIFDQCHFGLNVMKSTVCVGLTMKSIDYLAGGLPLINTIPGDTWDLIEQYHFGVNWAPGASIPWDRFDGANARELARSYFLQELTKDRFTQKVEAVVHQLEL